tara:strand:+ start:843 stop:1250 length:408 start_codon:yes stop_codon:yes gene_type:complete
MRAVFPAVRRLSAGPVHSRLTYELTACQTELRAANGLLRAKLHSELPLNPVAGTQNTPMLRMGYLPTAKLAGACTSAQRAVWALGRIDTHGAAPLFREHQAVNPATRYSLPLNPVAGRQSNTPAASLRFTAAHWR